MATLQNKQKIIKDELQRLRNIQEGEQMEHEAQIDQSYIDLQIHDLKQKLIALNQSQRNQAKTALGRGLTKKSRRHRKSRRREKSKRYKKSRRRNKSRRHRKSRRRNKPRQHRK